MRPSPLSHSAYSVVALGSLYFLGCAAPHFKERDIQKRQEMASAQCPASKKEEELNDACLLFVKEERYALADSSRLESSFSGKSLEYLFEDRRLFDIRIRPFEGFASNGDEIFFGCICRGKKEEELFAKVRLYDKQKHLYLPSKIEESCLLTSDREAYIITVRIQGSNGILEVTTDFSTSAGILYTAGCYACLNSSKKVDVITARE